MSILRHLIGIFAGIWVLAAGAEAAAQSAPPRLALVIGNGDYESITDLANPVNDANLIRETLEALGFEVIYRENADRASMERVISAFGQRLAQAGPSGVGLFYYAGHAVQSNGENYLLPSDVEAERESDLRFKAIRTSDLMAQMESSGVSNKIVVLDACRTNPFRTTFGTSQAGGLSDIGLGNSEFFVAFAATAGNIADDGNQQNSPYALALAKYLPSANSEISNTFRLVRNEVSASTGQRQLPEIRSTLRQEFYFSGSARGPQVVEQAPVISEQEATALALDRSSILGKWCTPGRSMGLELDISNDELRYMLGRDSAVYDIRRIELTDHGTFLVEWTQLGNSVVFEFGDFSSSGNLMTQIRGMSDGEWKEYNLRLRRC